MKIHSFDYSETGVYHHVLVDDDVSGEHRGVDGGILTGNSHDSM